MPAEINGTKLQLAMAFGQGAGVMLADAQALEGLFAEHADLLDNAMRNWDSSRWAFVELMRLLGQISAARAAARGSAHIDNIDISAALEPVLGLCPCRDHHPRQTPGDKG